MDWHKLQQTLYNIEPTDISSDYAKLKSLAGGDVPTKETHTDYLNESASVPPGSLQLDRNYDVSDFAKLAGVDVSNKQQLSEKTIGQKIGDIGAVKAFNRGRENYNRINLDFEMGDKKKPAKKPTASRKPAQSIPKELQKDHRTVKKHETVGTPQEIPAGTKMRDDQGNLYRWEGNMWTMRNPTTKSWQTGKIRNDVAFKMYMDAAKENPITKLFIPRTPSGNITQPNVRENDTMDNEKDTAQDKSNNAKINPVRLAKYFGGEDTMMLARAIAKMQSGRELARTEMMAVTGAFQALLDMDRERLRYLMSILTQAAKQPTTEAKKQKMPKDRNPHSQDLQALRKSGAGGAHRDKKRELPRKTKHKGNKGDISMESLKSDLERLLRDK